MTQALTTTHLTSLPIGDLYQLGKVLITTGFLPTAIKTTEQAVAVMLKGQELRIPPMYALSNIAIIQGKPAASAELMLALIYRDHGDDAIQFAETNATIATITYKRRTWKERREFSFTAADAKAAGLTGGNWNKYPAAMLRARCISAVARLAFPDTISGMYTTDELGVETNIETGEIVEALERPANGASYTSPSLPAIEAPKPAERPLVKRLRELVNECRTAGVAVPDLPRPRDMTDEQLQDAIDDMQAEYAIAQEAARAAMDDPQDEEPLL
jgi:hypothetical protein